MSGHVIITAPYHYSPIVHSFINIPKLHAWCKVKCVMLSSHLCCHSTSTFALYLLHSNSRSGCAIWTHNNYGILEKVRAAKMRGHIKLRVVRKLPTTNLNRLRCSECTDQTAASFKAWSHGPCKNDAYKSCWRHVVCLAKKIAGLMCGKDTKT